MRNKYFETLLIFSACIFSAELGTGKGSAHDNSPAYLPDTISIQYGKDRIEMKNVAGNPENAGILAQMKKNYDTELKAIQDKVVTGHGYEYFPKLFDRLLPWEQKATLTKNIDGDKEDVEKGQKKKSKKKSKKE